MSFEFASVVDFNSLAMGLSAAQRKYGLFVPMVLLDYLEGIALGAINFGGIQQTLAQAAIRSFFQVWKVDMITIKA